jgi:hypothetical protein
LFGSEEALEIDESERFATTGRGTHHFAALALFDFAQDTCAETVTTEGMCTQI